MYIKTLIGFVLLVFSVTTNASEEEIPTEAAKGVASALAVGLASGMLDALVETECEINQGADTAPSSTGCIELVTKVKVELERVSEQRCASPSQEDAVCAELSRMLDKVKGVTNEDR